MPRKKELIFGRIYRPVRFKLVFPANKRKLVEKLITDRTNTSSITRAKITITTKTWGNISFARYWKYWKIFKNLQIHKKLKGERNTRISRLISPLISRSDLLKILSNPQRTKKKKRERNRKTSILSQKLRRVIYMFAALFSPTGRFLAELPALHQCFLGTFTASGTSQLVYQTVRTAVACTGILECLCTALYACNVRKCTSRDSICVCVC